MKRDYIIIFLILLGGLYVTGFGIMTMVKFRELYFNGLVLVCFGIACTMLGIVGFIHEYKNN